MAESDTKRSQNSPTNGPGPHSYRPAQFRSLIHAGWIIPCGALILLACYSAQYGARRFLSIFATTVLIAGASLVAGAMLGFLFGVPRALQHQPGEPNGNTGTYAVNTNLEQISDWLTKILVGVGLVELGTISRNFGHFARTIGLSIGIPPTGPLIAGTDIILFSTWGFLLGYLLTRTYLTAAFRAFDVGEIVSQAAHEAATAATESAEERRREQDLVDAQTLSLASQILTPGLTSDSRPQLDRIAELENLVSKASLPMVEQVYQLARTLRTGNWNWRELTSGATNAMLRHDRTVPIFEILARHYPDDYRYHGDFGFALKDREIADYPASARELGIAMSLAGARSTPQAEHAIAWYAVNRAIAEIEYSSSLGPDYSERNRDQILSDIRKARAYGGGPAQVTERDQIKSWLLENLSA